MLTNVPIGMGRMLRSVVLNHPNTLECQVFRKILLRVAVGISGGLPTVGGLGVISAEDEHDIEYTHVGNGFALAADMFNQSPLFERGDAVLQAENTMSYLIEPEFALGIDGHFDVKKGDVIYMVISDAVRLAVEVVSPETPVNMSPFPSKFLCNRRSDLDLMPEGESGV
jgi:hypothetical protein